MPNLFYLYVIVDVLQSMRTNSKYHHSFTSEIIQILIQINRYKVMKQKYREKFGSNPKNFTTKAGEIIYPVKTLLAKGKCRTGQNKGSTIFRRAKVRAHTVNDYTLSTSVNLKSQRIIPSARADRGNTRRFSKIGRSVPIRVARAIVLKSAKR